MTRPPLTRWLFAAAAALALACEAPEASRPMPAGELYFPTGMFFARPLAADPGSGALFVASSNADRRYGEGRLTGIDVSSLACGTAPAGECLPAFPAPAAPVIDIPSLGSIDEKDLASLAGELDGIEYQDGSGRFRLVVPSRAEGSLLQFADASGAQLTCEGDPSSSDCSVNARSLEANRLSATGLPRAPAPYSVSISRPDGEAYVTSLQAADSPAASGQNLTVYIVRVANVFAPEITDDSFINLGTVRTESVVVGFKYAFVTGIPSPALRLIDRGTHGLFPASIETNMNLLDTRGLALSSDESRLYVVTRNPDSLMELAAAGTLTTSPSLSFTHVELLPLGASQVRVLDKPSHRGRVVFVTCLGTQSYDASGGSMGSLVVFDSEAGQPVATLDGFGFAPYGLAIQTIGAGARIYVGLYGEGRIAVVDVSNLENPEDVRLVARLGTSQVCLVNAGSRGCTSTSP